MVDLSSLIPKADPGTSMRRAKVLNVNSHTLTVDLGGPIIVQAWNSCNPNVGDWVDLLIQGTTAVAVGVAGGAYRQDAIRATASDSVSVTGLLSGVSTVVAKVGTFTVAVGDILPLIWAANGKGPWAFQAGVAYVPPSGGGSGGGSPPPPGGGGGGTYTYSYAAIASGWFSGGSNHPGDVDLGGTEAYFGYGKGRMYELAGKTIISGQIYLPRVSGSGSVTLSVEGHPGSTSTATGGWGALSVTRLSELVSTDTSTPVTVLLTGSGVLKGTPAGTIQITWS